MKNIMLIAVATLTIATANADYNWISAKPLQVVNNTPVTLVFRTWPDNQYFEVPAGQTVSGASGNEFEVDVAWQFEEQRAYIYWRPVFDGSQQEQGTMTDHSASISKKITQGNGWDIINVGYNDKLVFTSTSNSDGSMQLTATRERGVVVNGSIGGSTNDSHVSWAVFCLDNSMLLANIHAGTQVHCPIGETKIVIGVTDTLWINGRVDTNFNVYWDPNNLKADIGEVCTYNGSCSNNTNASVNGYYMDGFASTTYSSSNAQLNLYLNY